MRNLIVGISVVLALVGGPAGADTIYKCKFDRSAGKPEPGKFSLIIGYDGKSDTALTLDAWTHQDKRKKGPAEASVKRLSAHELRLIWSVPDVRFDSYSTELDYTVFLDTQSNTVDVTIRPVSYPPSLHFTGTCIAEQAK